MNIFWIEVFLFSFGIFFMIEKYLRGATFWKSAMASLILGLVVSWVLNLVISMVAFALAVAFGFALLGGIVWGWRKLSSELK